MQKKAKMLQGLRSKLKVAILIIVTVWIGLTSVNELLKPVTNGCAMTYMYPTYIPVSNATENKKFGIYLYHEGWKKIDFVQYLKNLNGVPVLFVPGNAGSYKQVRSLAAESARAYQGGPLERTFYQEAFLSAEEGALDDELVGFKLPNQYTSMLDWFAVDLEGEHSAMDGRILEEHTEYVVQSIHKILDLYKNSHEVREKGAAESGRSSKSVILVGHSMGGFVARAAIVHPNLRKGVVKTILTLSSPHQLPPLPMQPSLGHYFAEVNREWRKGYEVPSSEVGLYVSDATLSNVIVISISGGIHDYQVRSSIESLDGIVPPTHGFMISSTSMKNVWLSVEHQAILWCNQVVVQVSHTLLSLIDSQTGEPFPSSRKRLATFAKMLRSGTPWSPNWMLQSHLPKKPAHLAVNDEKETTESRVHTPSACPGNVHWREDSLERDLYIQTTTTTVLAMDGRRRWLDIQKLGTNGKDHFILVTNLAPCSGVRLHLWPEKDKLTSDLPAYKKVQDVTAKMVRIPSGPAPRQIEPGSQTEQPPPSAVLWLGPEDMQGFRFLTISVAPRPTVSGRPPPAASMAVGQFFNPEEGKRELSSWTLLHSAYSQQEVFLKEGHPLALNMTFSVSLGLLPVTLSLKTAGCGLKNSGLPVEEDGEAEDAENSRLCKLRCFPPLALAWDATSGLHIFPNLFSKTVVVDSSSALWSSMPGSEKTTVLLLVDPHCSYKSSVFVSVNGAAGRFLLVYGSEIVGFSIAVIFFSLMRQAHAWDRDLPIPSMLTAVESNLRLPMPFMLLSVVPILLSLLLSWIVSQPFPTLGSFIAVSTMCYLIANGIVIILALATQIVFYVLAIVHVFIKTRWQRFDGSSCFLLFQQLLKLTSRFFSFRGLRILRANPLIVTTLISTTLVCFVHPALGLSTLLLSHAFCCHSALCSFFTASFRSNAQRKELFGSEKEHGNGPRDKASRYAGNLNQRSHVDENDSSSPVSSKSFSETQLEIFHHRHGLLLLHLFAALMFVPSLAAWLQRTPFRQSFPWLLDAALCTGVILHGVCNSKLETNYLWLSFLGVSRLEVRLSFIYFLAGCFSYLSGLALAPYRAFYAMAIVGLISFMWKMKLRKNGDKGDAFFNVRKHSHKH